MNESISEVLPANISRVEGGCGDGGIYISMSGEELTISVH